MNWLLIVAIIMFISFTISAIFSILLLQPIGAENQLCKIIELTWNGTDWEKEIVYIPCRKNA